MSKNLCLIGNDELFKLPLLNWTHLKTMWSIAHVWSNPSEYISIWAFSYDPFALSLIWLISFRITRKNVGKVTMERRLPCTLDLLVLFNFCWIAGMVNHTFQALCSFSLIFNKNDDIVWSNDQISRSLFWIEPNKKPCGQLSQCLIHPTHLDRLDAALLQWQI